jgi:nucleotide-binding universal stress UspA family protein
MFEKPEIKRLLFATDLSKNAELAFRYAAAMGETYGARVTILYVVEKLPPNADLLLASLLGYSDIDELNRNTEIELIVRIQQHIERFCTETVNQPQACRFILHEVVVEKGNAVDRILHHAETGVYDVLVMGSRGHGIIKEAMVGSTSRKVLAKCPIPLFIVPERRLELHGG